MFFVVAKQAVAEVGELEEVILFLNLGERGVGMVRTTAVDQFLLGFEGRTAVAIKAGVRLLVNVSGVIDGLDELLAADVMAGFAGLDEVVEREVERGPDVLELLGHVVDI